MALWGGQAKGEMMGGGERGRRGCEERETELMRGRRRRRKRKRRLEERTRRRQEKSFKSVFFIGLQRCDHENDR